MREGLHVGIVVDEHKLDFDARRLPRAQRARRRPAHRRARGRRAGRGRPDACSSTCATPTPPTKTCVRCSTGVDGDAALLFTCNGRGTQPVRRARSRRRGRRGAARAGAARRRVLRGRDRPGRRAQLPARLHRQRRRLRLIEHARTPSAPSAPAARLRSIRVGRERVTHDGGAADSSGRRARTARAINVDPRARDGRGAEGELGSPGHADGARAARARAVDARHEVRRDRPRLARPRPLRAVGRARVDAALLDAVPHRLRPRARRPARVPPVGLAHARPPRVPATPRASRSRPVRSVRASATRSASRSPRSTCARASAPRSATTTCSASAATATSWRASATRPRRSPVTSGSVGSCSSTTTTTSRSTAPTELTYSDDVPEALRGLRLARRAARRGRRTTSTRSSAACARAWPRTTARRSSCCARTSATRRRSSPTRRRRTATRSVPTRSRGVKEILGLPADDFYVPDDVLALLPRGRRARRRRARRGSSARRVARREPERAEEYDACLSGTRARRAGSRSCRRSRPGTAIATRVAIARRCSTAVVDVVPGLFAGSADLTGNTGMNVKGLGVIDARRRERPPDPLRHPRARHGRGRERHGRVRARCRASARSSCSATTCARGAARGDHAAQGRASCGRTTRSASARTARRTSRSSTSRRCARCPACGVIRPADANEVAAAWRVHLDGDGPTGIVLTRQKVPVLDGTAERAPDGRRHAARTCSSTKPTTRSTSCSIGTGSEVVGRASRRASTLAARGVVGAGRVDAVVGPVRGAGRRRTATTVLPAGVPDARGRGRRARSAGSATPTTSSSIDRFGASAPGDVVMRELGITPEHVVERALALLGPAEEERDGQSDRAADRLRTEPLVRQPHPRARDGGLRRARSTSTASAASRRTRRSSRRRWPPGTTTTSSCARSRAAARRPRTRTGSSCSPTSRTRPTCCVPCYDELGRRRRVRVGRGVARPRARHRRHDRAGEGALGAARPAERDDQDPGDRGGLPAITAALAAGINVNVTLIFGLERYARGDRRVPRRARAARRGAATTSRTSRRSRRSS